MSRWRDAVCTLHAVERKKEMTAKEWYIRRGGWLELFPLLRDRHEAPQVHQNLATTIQDKNNKTFSQVVSRDLCQITDVVFYDKSLF